MMDGSGSGDKNRVPISARPGKLRRNLSPFPRKQLRLGSFVSAFLFFSLSSPLEERKLTQQPTLPAHPFPQHSSRSTPRTTHILPTSLLSFTISVFPSPSFSDFLPRNQCNKGRRRLCQNGEVCGGCGGWRGTSAGLRE